MTAPPLTLHRGIVKQVLSGDCIVVRGQPKGGPPPERTVCFSNVTAPRLARRPNPNMEGSQETKDEPFAWEAREFVRQKLIGKEVCFTIEYKVPGSGREYGCVYIGKDTTGENMTESLLTEGLVELRAGGIRSDDSDQNKLVLAEEDAKMSGIGKWCATSDFEHVRDIKWIVDNPRNYVDAQNGKEIDAVIEHVRDGCTVRAFLLPSFQYVTVMLSGVRCPMFKTDEEGKQVAEKFAEEAKYYTESRLLQREVKIVLETISNQNLVGSVLHPNGNIAELLLREGFARCVDWSMGVVSQGADKLRSAEKTAKEKLLRIWKDYKPTGPVIDIKDKSYFGKIVEVVNGDSLVVKLIDNQFRKIFLASIRPPRLSADGTENQPPISRDPSRRSRPLYDIPYMFEAREFLRKKLIGKKVNVQVDYIQPPSQGFPEKICATVTMGGINVAEALVSKGLARVIRYRQDDDQRSAHYDVLLAAETRAEKKGVGLHSKKEPPIHRVADIAGDVAKAKQFLPFLQRAGRSEATVEFIASGSRLRLYIPRETCLITFLVSGIDCPRGSRPAPRGIEGTVPAEPFGEEALQFTKEMCLQREVEVEVEAMDKGGNFIGWLFVDGVNLSIGLVQEGLAKVHFTAERSSHYQALLDAESNAQTNKLGLWLTYEETKEVEVVEEPVERSISYVTVVVTEVKEDMKFYAQKVDNGPQLDNLMEQLRRDMEAKPPLPGSYNARKGDLCAAKFSQDGQWYRAKIEKVEGGKIKVFYIDYGNREISQISNLATLAASYQTLSPQVTEYALACAVLPGDEEAKNEAVDMFYNDVISKKLQLNVEYRSGGTEHVTLLFADAKDDVAHSLIAGGYLLAEPRKEKRLFKIVSDYQKAQNKAKASRMNLWRYGDFTDDDAKEFGYQM